MTRYARALAVYRETSRQAWWAVLPYLPEVDRALVTHLGQTGGATCEELEAATGYRHQTVSAQVTHLVRAGFLTETSERRRTQSGRRAIVWALAEPQPAVVQEVLF